jgi:hypothetical protein
MESCEIKHLSFCRFQRADDSFTADETEKHLDFSAATGDAFVDESVRGVSQSRSGTA